MLSQAQEVFWEQRHLMSLCCPTLETVVHFILMNAESFKLNASKHKIIISGPLCLEEKKGFFLVNEVIVFGCSAGITKLNFLPLPLGRVYQGCSVEFLPTKGNEVLISAYKKKISCL